MRNPKVLFVYYSFTQQTAQAATTMAADLRARSADVTMAPLVFTDAHYGRRFQSLPLRWPIAKIVGMLPAQARKKTGEIQIPDAAMEGDYDLVVLGAPTWWLTTCMPMRSYLLDPSLEKVVKGKPFAVFSTSRRYYKRNIKTMREAGEKAGGNYIDETHFLAEGNQVMSMWSWLVFMRHNVEKRHWFGVPMPKPNLRVDYDKQATDFIGGVAERALASPAADAG